MVHRKPLYADIERIERRYIRKRLTGGQVAHLRRTTNDLRYLATGSVGAWPEVWSAQVIARFPNPAASVTADYTPGCYTLNIYKERAIGRYIRECLRCRCDRFIEA